MSPGSVDRTPNEVMRRQLFEAAGIITVTRYALASNLEGLDEESVIDALSAAAKLIDDIAGTLATPER